MTAAIFMTRLISVSMLLSMLLMCSCGMSMAQSSPEPLHVWRFLESGPPPNEHPLPPHTHRWVLRESRIQFNDDALRSLRNLNQPSLPRMVMDLSEGLTREVVVRSRKSSERRAILVEGRLSGNPEGVFTLSLQGEAVSGRVQIGPRVWSIEARESGSHRLIEIDPEQMPRD